MKKLSYFKEDNDSLGFLNEPKTTIEEILINPPTKSLTIHYEIYTGLKLRVGRTIIDEMYQQKKNKPSSKNKKNCEDKSCEDKSCENVDVLSDIDELLSESIIDYDSIIALAKQKVNC